MPRPRAICQRRHVAAYGACGFRALAARARAHQGDQDRGGEEGARRGRGNHRRRACQGHHALGRRAHAFEGPQIGAAARDRRGSCLLAGRGGVRGGGAHARASRGRLRIGRGEIRGADGGDRSGNRARQENAGHPAGTGRQSLLRAQAGSGRARSGFRRGRRGGGNDLHVRTPHRSHHRAARGGRRLERRRAAFDRLSRHAGAAHDAEPVCQASRSCRAPGARCD